MDLKMEVYTPQLDLLGMLEAHRSVVWETKAFGAGSFSVDALILPEAKSLLVPDNVLWIEGDTAGVVEYVQERSGKDGPYITVKGPDLTGILGQRILWGRYDLKGTPPQIMHALVDDCCVSPTRGDAEARKIPSLVSLAPAAGGDTIRMQKTGGTLLEALEELGSAYGVAFGVRFNPAVPQMEFWTRWGQNRSVNQTVNDPVFYSTELDDVLSSEYSYNAQDWKNVALVAGEGEGADRVMVTVNADGDVEPLNMAEFIPNGNAVVLKTSEGRKFTTRSVSGEESYVSAYTGPQIDEGIRKALSGGGGGTAGVSSFKGRTGAVTPQNGDYTADMVGAATIKQVYTAIQEAILDSWEGLY